jgi:hypothetical protein
MKTWKQKLGKRLMKHVTDTTERGTLAEVKRNLEHHRLTGISCFDCKKIADKLGLTP